MQTQLPMLLQALAHSPFGTVEGDVESRPSRGGPVLNQDVAHRIKAYQDGAPYGGSPCGAILILQAQFDVPDVESEFTELEPQALSHIVHGCRIELDAWSLNMQGGMGGGGSAGLRTH